MNERALNIEDILCMPTWPNQREQESIVSKIPMKKEEIGDNTSKMRFPLSTRAQIQRTVFGSVPSARVCLL